MVSSVPCPTAHPDALGLGAVRDDGPSRVPSVPVAGLASLPDGGGLMVTPVPQHADTDTAEAIVRDLAAVPLTYSDWRYDGREDVPYRAERCADCGCWMGESHADDCIWERARTLLAREAKRT